MFISILVVSFMGPICSCWGHIKLGTLTILIIVIAIFIILSIFP